MSQHHQHAQVALWRRQTAAYGDARFAGVIAVLNGRFAGSVSQMPLIVGRV